MKLCISGETRFPMLQKFRSLLEEASDDELVEISRGGLSNVHGVNVLKDSQSGQQEEVVGDMVILINIINARKWGQPTRTLNYIAEEEEMNLDTEIKEGTNEEEEGEDWQIVKRDSERQFYETKTLCQIFNP